jgi:hypothetical protein
MSLRAWAIVALSVLCAGCFIPYYTNTGGYDDAQWSGERLRFVAHTRRSVDRMGGWESHSRVIREDWRLDTVQFIDLETGRTLSRPLHHEKGETDHGFLVITGSDLLLHGHGNQWTLFDPQSLKDVSKAVPAGRVLNRSRTAFLTDAGGQIAIFDTLSVFTDKPKVIARPQWFEEMKRVSSGWNPVLTDDSRYLVLIRPSYLLNQSLTPALLICSTNGVREERKFDSIRDAESLDGEVVLLFRCLTKGGFLDEVKLIKTDGTILAAGEIRASDGGWLWNTAEKAILFMPYDRGENQAFEVWNYPSNSVQRVRF